MRHHDLPTDTSPNSRSALITPVTTLRAGAAHRAFATRPTTARASRPTTVFAALLSTCMEGHITGYYRA